MLVCLGDIKDRLKERLANKNGITIIRLLQEDVLAVDNDWDKLLSQNILRSRIDPTITHVYEGCQVDVEYITELAFRIAKPLPSEVVFG